MDLQRQADQKPGFWDDRASAGSIRATLYPNDFSRVFSSLLAKTGVTTCQIAKFPNLSEGYLSQLKSGEMRDPPDHPKDLVAMAHLSPQFALSDAERLLNPVGRSLEEILVPNSLTRSPNYFRVEASCVQRIIYLPERQA